MNKRIAFEEGSSTARGRKRQELQEGPRKEKSVQTDPLDRRGKLKITIAYQGDKLRRKDAAEALQGRGTSRKAGAQR